MTESDQKQNTTQRGRQINLVIPDKTYMDLLIKIRHENLNWRKFFRILIKGFLEDDSGIMDYIDNELALQRSKARSKVLKKERTDYKETIKAFGLDREDIDDIYDILEEEVEP
jgi:hypothetical protein